jgi:hypothetical protein
VSAQLAHFQRVLALTGFNRLLHLIPGGPLPVLFAPAGFKVGVRSQRLIEWRLGFHVAGSEGVDVISFEDKSEVGFDVAFGLTTDVAKYGLFERAFGKLTRRYS